VSGRYIGENMRLEITPLAGRFLQAKRTDDTGILPLRLYQNGAQFMVDNGKGVDDVIQVLSTTALNYLRFIDWDNQGQPIYQTTALNRQ